MSLCLEVNGWASVAAVEEKYSWEGSVLDEDEVNLSCTADEPNEGLNGVVDQEVARGCFSGY